MASNNTGRGPDAGKEPNAEPTRDEKIVGPEWYETWEAPPITGRGPDAEVPRPEDPDNKPEVEPMAKGKRK